MANDTGGLVRAILAADATYAALSTGGIVAINATGAAPVNTTDTPLAYATVSGVKTFTNPVTVVAVSADEAVGPAGIGIDELVRISWYAPAGYVTTRAMRLRARVLLHGDDGEMWFTFDDGRRCCIRYDGSGFRETVEPTIKGLPSGQPAASMESSRFRATTTGG